ncbi:MAG: hypothetical protein CM1200mP26_18600 [Acidimicrobiales bacterium]|nr:MAG: hypothetical protein CM1200mP26_18600 [Acidimicrobiales bacterium]
MVQRGIGEDLPEADPRTELGSDHQPVTSVLAKPSLNCQRYGQSRVVEARHCPVAEVSEPLGSSQEDHHVLRVPEPGGRTRQRRGHGVDQIVVHGLAHHDDIVQVLVQTQRATLLARRA